MFLKIFNVITFWKNLRKYFARLEKFQKLEVVKTHVTQRWSAGSEVLGWPGRGHNTSASLGVGASTGWRAPRCLPARLPTPRTPHPRSSCRPGIPRRDASAAERLRKSPNPSEAGSLNLERMHKKGDKIHPLGNLGDFFYSPLYFYVAVL